MIFEILVEDQSGQKLLEHIFEKYRNEKQTCIEDRYRAYRGIGGLGKGKNAVEIKSEHLLNDLSKRLRAIQEAYRYGEDSVCIVVALDNDTKDTEEFRKELENVARKANIEKDYFFAIAIEEMEAWILGDFEAIVNAYPDKKDRILSKYSQYTQDSICGTWEVLADMLTKNGIKEFKQKNPTYIEVGKCKYDWADQIGRYMRIRDNRSPSFSSFIAELDARCG